jgi:hypothetical protein
VSARFGGLIKQTTNPINPKAAPDWKIKMMAGLKMRRIVDSTLPMDLAKNTTTL